MLSESEATILSILVQRGEEMFNAPKEPIRFTGDDEADLLLNNLEEYPHAYVLACVMDQQVKAERAWLIPYKISEKVGGFTMAHLVSLSLSDIRDCLTKPEKLHRFIDKMSSYLLSGIQRIDNVYGGNASRIWSDAPSSAEVVYRFLQFDGVGPKIASMATNILARQLKIPMSDYFSIDVSADVHVRRVFVRLGLCDPKPTVDQVIYKARALHPEFPGIIDAPCWRIGRTWCNPRKPACEECYMQGVCPSVVEYNAS